MRWVDRLLENTTVYRCWQAPFAAAKLAPVLRANDMTAVESVLDVGCGPGTNTAQFSRMRRYLGVDINMAYTTFARRRYGRDFVVGDATSFAPAAGERFDFILLNSFLHHIDDAEASRTLDALARCLTPEGHVHIVDLVLPESRDLAWALCKLDRGRYPRRVGEWRSLLEKRYLQAHLELYTLGVQRLPLWNMLYFKGRPRP
jgi:SAM-dependent methyltransferase